MVKRYNFNTRQSLLNTFKSAVRQRTNLSYILSCRAASERSSLKTFDSSAAAASDVSPGGVELGVTKSSRINKFLTN